MEASFTLIASDDWQGLEYAIQRSDSVTSFISPAILVSSALSRFLSSRTVLEPLKQAVLERFTEFAGGAIMRHCKRWPITRSRTA